MSDNIKKKCIPLSLTVAIILLDQLTKALVVSVFPLDGSGRTLYKVFGGDFLWFAHVRNKAIAFSLGEGLPEVIKPIVFIILPVLVLTLLMVYYFRDKDFTTLQRWAIAGIVGGGLGNIIDRVFRPDGVVDFISVNFYGLLGFTRWPTFNLADSAVVVCGALLFISLFFSKSGQKGGVDE